MRVKQPTPVASRFWKHVQVGEAGECWPWVGYHDREGYGRIRVGGRGSKLARASRVIYELVSGPVGEMQVLHRCDNPRCVNPAHLFLGTHKDNMRDAAEKGRRKGERNGRAKLTEADVREIRALYPIVGRTPLSKRFGIAPAYVPMIAHGKTWKEVSGV